jgi:hypothetical protein
VHRRRDCDVRAGRTHCLAHASTRSNTDRNRGLRMGVARRRKSGGDPSGDVVWFEPGEKHWHGATATTAMSHIAIAGALNGKAVDWMEKVTDEQYRAT